MGRSLSDRPLYVGFQGVAVVARALADTGAVAFDPKWTLPNTFNLIDRLATALRGCTMPLGGSGCVSGTKDGC